MILDCIRKLGHSSGKHLDHNWSVGFQDYLDCYVTVTIKVKVTIHVSQSNPRI